MSRVAVFGATGMLGQGVLRECLLDSGVDSVLAADLFDLGPIAEELTGLDACFFCLGVSSADMKEVDYRRVTYDLRRAGPRTRCWTCRPGM